ncbi:hypothetical protein GCM10010343_14110 [Streptomyces avidinii]|nr:hypothetical protein GCM10010343_14110 [Streptomyces avidinii]
MHAAAAAVPALQSAWLKAHHPAVLYAGLLEHDPWHVAADVMAPSKGLESPAVADHPERHPARTDRFDDDVRVYWVSPRKRPPRYPVPEQRLFGDAVRADRGGREQILRMMSTSEPT